MLNDPPDPNGAAWAKQLDAVGQRDEAVCAILLAQRYVGETDRVEEVPDTCHVTKVVRTSQPGLGVVRVVFLSTDWCHDCGDGLARGWFVIVDERGRLMPTFANANVFDEDDALLHLPDGRLATAQVIPYGVEQTLVPTLQITPIGLRPRPILTILLGPPRSEWFVKGLDEHVRLGSDCTEIETDAGVTSRLALDGGDMERPGPCPIHEGGFSASPVGGPIGNGLAVTYSGVVERQHFPWKWRSMAGGRTIEIGPRNSLGGGDVRARFTWNARGYSGPHGSAKQRFEWVGPNQLSIHGYPNVLDEYVAKSKVLPGAPVTLEHHRP